MAGRQESLDRPAVGGPWPAQSVLGSVESLLLLPKAPASFPSTARGWALGPQGVSEPCCPDLRACTCSPHADLTLAGVVQLSHGASTGCPVCPNPGPGQPHSP